MGWVADIARGLLGIALLLAFCIWLSRDRRQINWRLVGGGLLLQLALAVLVLKFPPVAFVLERVTEFFVRLLEFANVGSAFLFGELTDLDSFGRVLAIRVLPTIVFFSALTSVLYYLGFLQRLVYAFAWLMHKTMRLSGAESLAAAANVFVGMTEAPLMVKPYVARMTRSELLCLMTGGMATIAGAVFVIYMQFLGGVDEARQILFGKHLLAASILSAPAAIVCAKILLPEMEEVDRDLKVNRDSMGVNIFDALMQGTTQGVYLAVNVGAALLVFIAMIALVNYVITTWVGSWTGINAGIFQLTGGAYEGLTLQFVFGVVFAPVAWLLGIDLNEIIFIGQLLGEKLVANEFVAYRHLGEMVESGTIVSERSVIIASYALCGFANFTSMGIQIGGISVIAPSQRENLAKLALLSLIGGTVACNMTACIAAMVLR